MKMRTILVSALLLLSAAFLVCRLLKKNRISIFSYQVGLVIIAFTALLRDNVLLTCCIAAICVPVDRERRKFRRESDEEDQK